MEILGVRDWMRNLVVGFAVATLLAIGAASAWMLLADHGTQFEQHRAAYEAVATETLLPTFQALAASVLAYLFTAGVVDTLRRFAATRS